MREEGRTLAARQTSPIRPLPLAGASVAISGRLATLSRAEMRTLVAHLGGTQTSKVDRQTTHLVLGDGNWPLSLRGRISTALRRARRLVERGQPLTIFSEQEFLARYHFQDRAVVRRLFTQTELARQLAISISQLRAWQSRGWLPPAQ